MLSTYALDCFDLRILEALQIDGSISNQELSEKIGLSPSPCSRRVKRLEELEIIRHKVALLDRKKLGLDLTAIIQISMDRHTCERFDEFEQRVISYSEVQECFLITGSSADYMLKIVVPDMAAYQQFLLNKITRIEGVSGVHSSFVMRRVVDSNALPLGYLGTRME